MNLILTTPEDHITENCVRLNDRRFQHIRQIHAPSAGDSLKVGELNGKIGTGKVMELSDQEIILELDLRDSPPSALPCTLVLALPRPKMLKRVLQTVAAMGIKELFLTNSYRVDKSYWSSPVLARQIEENLILGLEQAGDTQMPTVHLKKRFKPFVEDELAAISNNTHKLIAHPYHAKCCPPPSLEATTLVVGPEGGFIPYEIEKLNEIGFESFHIGQRILRVENAIPALLSRLFLVQ